MLMHYTTRGDEQIVDVYRKKKVADKSHRRICGWLSSRLRTFLMLIRIRYRFRPIHTEVITDY